MGAPVAPVKPATAIPSETAATRSSIAESQLEIPFKIERVICAVDCGVAVNPNIVAMQMESGIGFGLSAALSGAITLKEGIVEQSNFHDYPVVRMNQMPKIEVFIVPSNEKPTGVGEPATPVIAPALANAILAMRGKPLRALPMSSQGVSFV